MTRVCVHARVSLCVTFHVVSSAVFDLPPSSLTLARLPGEGKLKSQMDSRPASLGGLGEGQPGTPLQRPHGILTPAWGLFKGKGKAGVD